MHESNLKTGWCIALGLGILFTCLAPRCSHNTSGAVQSATQAEISDPATVILAWNGGTVDLDYWNMRVDELRKDDKSNIDGWMEREDLLKKIIHERLLVQKAMELGLDRQGETRRLLFQRQATVLDKAVVTAEVNPSLREPSDSELRNWYEDHKEERYRIPGNARALQILVRSHSDGIELRRKILHATKKQRAELDRLESEARRIYGSKNRKTIKTMMKNLKDRQTALLQDMAAVFNHFASKANLSTVTDLGLIFQEGNIKVVGFDRHLLERIFALRQGEISPPLKSRKGWHVIMVYARDYEASMPFEPAKGHILYEYRNERSEKARKVYLEGLKKEYNVLYNKRLTDRITGRPVTSDGSSSEFSDDVLVTYKGGRVTIDEYNARLEEARKIKQESVDGWKEREALFEQIVDDHLMLKKGRQLGLDRKPAYRREIEKIRTKILETAAIKKEVYDKLADPTEKELREYYDEHKEEEFRMFGKVRVKHILTETRHEAWDARKKLLAGADFDKLALAMSKSPKIDLGLVFYGGHIKTVGFDRLVMDKIFSLEQGELSKPVKSRKGWHIFLVYDREKKAFFDFNLVRKEIEYKFQDERLKGVIDKYVEKLEKEYGMVRNRELIKVIIPKTREEMKK